MLEALDPSTVLGRIYTALIAHPGSTAAQMGEITELPQGAVQDSLMLLLTRGLASRHESHGRPDMWDAEPPDRVMEEALDAEAQRLAAAHRASRQLSRLHWMARREASDYIGLEVIRDATQVRQQYHALLSMATRHVHSLNRPPFLTGGDPQAIDAQVTAQRASMNAGVAYKAIWWGGLFNHPEAALVATATMNAGEEARLLAELPMKLIIVDDQRAMLPLDPDDLTDGATLLIHPSGLLTTLISIFGTLWRLATPISDGATAAHRPQTSETTEMEHAILQMLIAGATDDTIARRLKISRRTVLRHCASMFDRLGAQTRFQAGAAAVRRGWL